MSPQESGSCRETQEHSGHLSRVCVKTRHIANRGIVGSFSDTNLHPLTFFFEDQSVKHTHPQPDYRDL